MGGGSSKGNNAANKASTDAKSGAPTGSSAPKDTKKKGDTSPAKTKPGTQEKKGVGPFTGAPHEQSMEIQKEAFLDGCADELQIDRAVIVELHKHYEVLCKRAGSSGHYTGKISINSLLDKNPDTKKNAMERLLFEFMASTASLEEKKLNPSGADAGTTQAGSSGSSEKRIDFKSFARFMSVFVADADNLDSKLTALFLVLCQAGNGDRKDIMTTQHLKALKDQLRISNAETTFPGRDTWNCQRFIQETKIEFQKEPDMFRVNLFKRGPKGNDARKRQAKPNPDSGAGLGTRLQN
eukprot:TRINITY_DN2525_c0_g3_i3.p1 TRINITY_DN2525_c0_g3~~TRINITY_DN2525_c0_g3_i3.p1  ORF type:complete len:295 (+),score=74.69 TRINITY_DN2525_c0_g3_i3:130-1014(+)